MEETRVLKRKLKRPQSWLACQPCRARKVRCDLAEKKSSCTGCQRKGISCTIVPGRRRGLVEQMLNASDNGNSITEWPSVTDAGSTPSSTSGSSSIRSSMSSSPAAFSEYSTAALSEYTESTSVALSWIDSPGKNQVGEGPLPVYCEAEMDPIGSLSPSIPLEHSNRQQTGWIDTRTRLELLEAYGKWIHPILPMVDFQALADTREHAMTTSLVSMSAMLAASTFIDIPSSTRDELRDHTRKLIGLEVLTGSVALLQSMILMTFVDSNSAGERYWLSLASAQAAKLVQLGYNDDHSFRLTFQSLVVRDTMLSLSRRRSCHVQLSLAQSPIGGGDSCIKFSPAFLPLQSLCSIIRSALGTSNSKPGTPSAGLLESLQFWGQLNAPEAETLDCDDSEAVHWAVVYGLWSLAVLTFFCSSQGDSAHTGMPEQPTTTQMVSAAISTSTNIHQQLYERDLVRFLPSVSVSALVPVTVAHLLNTTSEDKQARLQSNQKYYLCWQVLRALRSRHSQAAAAMMMIDSVGQDLRKSLDATRSDQTRRLRDWTGSQSSPSTVSEDDGVAVELADDQAWLAFLSTT